MRAVLKSLFLVLFIVIITFITFHIQANFKTPPFPVTRGNGPGQPDSEPCCGGNPPPMIWVNENTGIVGYNSSIYRTTNGGLNWMITLTDSVCKYRGLSFINMNTGFTIKCSGKIYKTVNNGVNWSLLNNLSPYYLTAIQFLDSSTGFIAGYLDTAGVFLKTTNGGINWQSINFPNKQNDVYFINSNTGWLVGRNKTIYKTTNSGLNFNSFVLTDADELFSIKFLNSNYGVIAGNIGKIYITINSGANWINRSPNNLDTLKSISITGTDTIFTGGSYNANAKIYKSLNGGLNWISLQTEMPRKYIHRVQMLNALTGFVYCDSGYVLKTNDGGMPVGIINLSYAVPDNFKLLQNYPNPFNPRTKIQFAIPKNGFVKLTVFDIKGRTMAVLANETMQPGTYEAEWDASHRASGVYFYKLETESFSETKRMVLIK